jgi:uncharacterized protein HemX
MDLAIGVLALIVAGVSLGMVMWLRGQVPALQAEVSALRRDLEQTHNELGELKAATEIAPAPPLPKARPGGLDDLREQLRAAHRESDNPTEE